MTKHSTRTLSALSLLTLVLVALTACATNRPAGEQISDATITAKVTAKLVADPEVNPFNIDVDTLDRVVTLRGEVEKSVARSEAAKHAASVDGVRRVVNRIKVVSAAEEDDERLSDTRIRAKVKAKIAADPALNPLNIDVDVDDAEVTLSGVVKNSANRAEAEKLARSVSGVRRVHNELQIKG